MRLAIVLASLSLAACFPPRPASERPLSYRAPVPGWVRHDVDSTLSLLLPPELERQPRADSAFAPVLFVSDSARVTVRFGTDARRAFPDSTMRIGDMRRDEVRNGNPVLLARFSSKVAPFGQAGFYYAQSNASFLGILPSRNAKPLPGAERFEYPSVLVKAEVTDSLAADHVFDYVRLAFRPYPPRVRGSGL